MPFSQVLVPLDGSETAEVALPYAEAIALATGASLVLLTVLPHEMDAKIVSSPEVRDQVERMGRERIEEYLAVTAHRLEQAGIATSVSVVDGVADEQIVIAANSASLTVIAAAGHGWLERLFVGSSTQRVVHAARRPVLLVHADRKSGHVAPAPIRRILVPLDGSAAAEDALVPAAELASGLNASLMLLHVEPFGGATIAFPGAEVLHATGQNDETRVTEAAMIYLDGLKAGLPSGIEADTLVLRGNAVDNLLEYARVEPVDLTVLTSHGHGARHHKGVGSVAGHLLRAGVPAMLIPNAVGD